MNGFTSAAASLSLDSGALFLLCLCLAAALLICVVCLIFAFARLPRDSERIAEKSRAAWREDISLAAEQIRTVTLSKMDAKLLNIQLNLERAMQSQAKGDREEASSALKAMQDTIATSLANNDKRIQNFANEQNRRVEALTSSLSTSIAELKHRVDEDLKNISKENETKLEKIRETVEEKLQSTLTSRVSESFAQVSQQLTQVYKGLGEMKELAADVGGLKRVLVNVKSRGMLGEVQLEALLSEYFTADQYVKNAHTLADQKSKVVEFAVVLPGIGCKECLLPIDSKFPIEDYKRLQDAAEEGDSEKLKKAKEAIRGGLIREAKSVSAYINPPHTTDFAIMFIPSEGLYAEALSLDGLTESLYRDYHVYIMGPSTLASALCAYRAGFQTLAIEKKSSEIRSILIAVQAEFGKFQGTLDKLRTQAETVVKTVEQVEVRTRQMNRKLAHASQSEEDSNLTLEEAPKPARLPDSLQ